MLKNMLAQSRKAYYRPVKNCSFFGPPRTCQKLFIFLPTPDLSKTCSFFGPLQTCQKLFIFLAHHRPVKNCSFFGPPQTCQKLFIFCPPQTCQKLFIFWPTTDLSKIVHFLAHHRPVRNCSFFGPPGHVKISIFLPTPHTPDLSKINLDPRAFRGRGKALGSRLQLKMHMFPGGITPTPHPSDGPDRSRT
jgi:hypothetical protein